MVKQQNDSSQEKQNARNHKLRKVIPIAVAVIVVGGIAWATFSGNSSRDEAVSLFTVKRGDLRISVLEAGNLQAQKSVSLTCQMRTGGREDWGRGRGGTTIISIVPEGTTVEEGDVLAELDSSYDRDEIDRHQIIVNSEEARLRTAEEAYEIQKNQNDSDTRAAELAVEFAKIDLEKYTAGESEAELANAAQLALDFASNLLSKYAAEDWAKQLGETEAEPTNGTGKNENDSGTAEQDLSLDFAEMGLHKLAGGDWHQLLRSALYDIVSADTSLKLKKDKVEGTRELFKKRYVTETQLNADESEFQNAVINLKKAVEALRLLVNYDHLKQLAWLTANYEEAGRELGRVTRKAASKLAQKQVDLDTQTAKYRMEKERLDNHKEQLDNSIIKAPQPGLVIYSSSLDRGPPWHRRGRIAEGETVRERQRIIELPDLSSLKVDMNLQESSRDVVKPGQQAIITFEAAPGVTLRGHVEKVALLPDSERHWMNPDLTLYPARILADETSEAVKPGMTAKVEIFVSELKDVLYVPLQAVTIRRNRDVCYLVKQGKKKETPVVVGLSNHNYIEIKSGLTEGDKVLTNAPVTLAEATALKKPDVAEFEKKWPARKDQTPVGPKGEEEEPEKPPADTEEKAKAFLQNLTPEQKKQMEERLKALGIEGEITPEGLRKIMERRGGPRPAGQRPPGGPGPRREGRPRGPSAVRTTAEETKESGNQ